MSLSTIALSLTITTLGAGSQQASEYTKQLLRKENAAVVCQVFNRHKAALELPSATVIHPTNLIAELPEIFKNTASNTVLISLPHDLSARATLASLRAGKLVIKEKPLALTTAELDLYAQYPDSKIFTLTQRGSSPVFLNAKANLHKIGNIRNFDFKYLASFGPPSGWRAVKEQTVGGATLDMGSHMFQVVAMLFDGIPEISEAKFEYDHAVSEKEQLDDRVVTTLRYENFQGTVVIDRHSGQYAETVYKGLPLKYESYLVHGDEGSMEITKTGYTIKNKAGRVIEEFSLSKEDSANLGDFLQQKTIDDFLSGNEAIYARNFDTNSRAVRMIEEIYSKAGNPLRFDSCAKIGSDLL